MSLTRDEFVAALATLAGSVYDFHQRFDGAGAGPEPSTEKSLAALRDRLPFLIEEMGEHAQQLNRGSLREAALEMTDVAFVAMGSLLTLHGLGTEACRAVAAKNDAKTSETHEFQASSGKIVRRAVRP